MTLDLSSHKISIIMHSIVGLVVYCYILCYVTDCTVIFLPNRVWCCCCRTCRLETGRMRTLDFCWPTDIGSNSCLRTHRNTSKIQEAEQQFSLIHGPWTLPLLPNASTSVNKTEQQTARPRRTQFINYIALIITHHKSMYAYVSIYTCILEYECTLAAATGDFI